MKKIMGILGTAGFCFLMACNSSTTTQDSVDSVKDRNDSMLPDSNSSAMASAPASEEDAQWAVKAANAGMTEVELSKVAQTKATMPRVKSFADMMVTDHTAAGDKLKSLASAKSITLPDKLSDASQKKLDDLNKKSGKDFDKAYINVMVSDHKDAVDHFEKGSKDLKDADLKNFASTTLPTLQMHLDSIKAIDNKK